MLLKICNVAPSYFALKGPQNVVNAVSETHISNKFRRGMSRPTYKRIDTQM